MYKEVNTGTNLPAQIDLFSTMGDEYHFLFIAKGGGTANKSRSVEHTSELQSRETISYAVFCLKKKNTHTYI